MTHQESCSECRDYFQSHASLFRAIDQGLSSIANSPVPPSLLPAVRARLAGQPAGHSFRFHGWPLAALATAALVVVFAFFWHRPTQRDKAVPDVARVTAPRTLDPERDTPVIPESPRRAELRPHPGKQRSSSTLPAEVTHDEPSSEVIVLAEEREAFVRFVAEVPENRAAAAGLTRRMPENEPIVEIALLTIKPVEVKLLESSEE